MRVGIVGAGIAGKVLALELIHRGVDVEIFEAGADVNPDQCSYSGAGLLAPVAELLTADSEVCIWGLQAVSLWQQFSTLWNLEGVVSVTGGVVIADDSGTGMLAYLAKKIAATESMAREVRGLERKDLPVAFSERKRPPHGLFVSATGYTDSRKLLSDLSDRIRCSDASFYTGTSVHIEKNKVKIPGTGEEKSFCFVLDCRGLSARPEISDLRGVRGETVLLKSPDLHGIVRPVHILHHNRQVYLVPRGQEILLVGATMTESESKAGVSVRSTFELLTPVLKLMPFLGDAEVLELNYGIRPAFPDHKPRIRVKESRLSINGMFRHGFLLAPLIAQSVAEFLVSGKINQFMEDCCAHSHI